MPKLFLVRFVRSLSRRKSSWTFTRADTPVKANTSVVFVERGFHRRGRWRITSSSTGRREDTLVTTVESHLPGTPTLESTWKSTPREARCHQSQQEGIIKINKSDVGFSYSKWIDMVPSHSEELPSNYSWHHSNTDLQKQIRSMIYIMIFKPPKFSTTSPMQFRTTHATNKQMQQLSYEGTYPRPWRLCLYVVVFEVYSLQI